jgi:hypothetical protein
MQLHLPTNQHFFLFQILNPPSKKKTAASITANQAQASR